MEQEHYCHAVMCWEIVPAQMLMCNRHWRMVPKMVQNLIWHHYREGQEIDKQPSVDYLATAFVAISTVALQEGVSLPSMAPQWTSTKPKSRESGLSNPSTATETGTPPKEV